MSHRLPAVLVDALDKQSTALLGVVGRGVIGYANEGARDLLAGGGDIVGRVVHEFIPDEFRAAHRAYEEGYRANPTKRPMGNGRVLYALRTDGTRFPVEIGLGAQEVDGRQWVWVTLVDLTLRRELENAREHAAVTLASALAHDFNNLLGTIRGNTAWVRDQTSHPEFSEALDDAIAATDAAASLARQMLAYGDRQNAAAKPTDIGAAINEMLPLLKSMAGRRTVLHLECEDRPAIAKVDVGRLRQLMLSLVNGAREGVGEQGGRIRVSVSVRALRRDEIDASVMGAPVEPGTFVAIDVVDDGASFTPDQLKAIFEPFGGRSATSRGIEIASALATARVFGGTIAVRALARGLGVTILMPARDTIVPPSPKPTGETGRPAVLVVDDDDRLRRATQRMLNRAGFAVVQASGGETALDVIDSGQAQVAVILLDLTMPGMSGHDVVSTLRERESTIPIVLMSGYSNESIESHAANPHVVGFLSKPFTVEGLVNALRPYVEN